MFENYTANLKVPEFIMQESFEALLNAIRLEYSEAIDKKTTWLYQTFSTPNFQRYKFYEQIVDVIITKDQTHPRFVRIDLMHNAKFDKMPSVFISLPSETQQPNGNGIGFDEGYGSYEYYKEDDDEMELAAPYLTRRFQSNYNVVILSDNSNEVILLYNLFKAIAIGGSGHFNQAGLENYILSGADLTNKDIGAPPTVYTRAFSLNVQYDLKILSLNKLTVPTDINFIGHPINK